jgi:hypothetical protein
MHPDLLVHNSSSLLIVLAIRRSSAIRFTSRLLCDWEKNSWYELDRILAEKQIYTHTHTHTHMCSLF